MDYYKLLQLDREPFSNSPDPDYFYRSKQHVACLQKLELALRLKRGLNVVIGDVGTGKTTLCRQLIRKFADDGQVESHLILDPSFDSTVAFLQHLHELICDQKVDPTVSDLALKESIKQHLFSKGVDQHKTVVLIIDEGQKISAACLEILRELLNFETNTYKLLQIIIFAQLEFEQLLDQHANFSDRINLLHYLAPMDFTDTRQMVRHRLKLASTEPRPKKIFTTPALWAIYRSSRGYPRKIIHLCHQSVLAMIIQNRTRAGWSLIRSCKKRLSAPKGSTRRTASVLILLLLVGAAFLAYQSRLFGVSGNHRDEHAFKVHLEPQPSPQGTVATTPPANAGAQYQQDAQSAVPEKSVAAATSPASANAPDLQTSHPERAVEPPLAVGPPEPIPQTDGNGPDPLPVQSSNPPDQLGKLIVKPGDTLVGLVHQVYGTHRNAFLRAVIDANPQIADPNVIDIGNVLSFPPLPHEIRHPAAMPCWVQLSDYESLPEAVQRVHQISSTTQIPVQMIPNWSPNTGLRFQLLIKGYFPDEPAAAEYADALPKNYTGAGKVMASWPEGTVFYSDPYAGNAH